MIEKGNLEELGSKIKKLRKERGFSLTFVANAIGLSHNFLSEVERGKKEPSYATLRSLAEFYKIDEDEFFSIINKLPLRTIEYIEGNSNIQKILSNVQKKYGNDKEKLERITKQILKIYEDFLEEEDR